jgi:hypothetical protein
MFQKNVCQAQHVTTRSFFGIKPVGDFLGPLDYRMNQHPKDQL